MISISFRAFFDGEVVSVDCEADVEDDIWIMLLQQFWDFEERMVYGFERFWFSDDLSTGDGGGKARNDFFRGVGFDVEEGLDIVS